MPPDPVLLRWVGAEPTRFGYVALGIDPGAVRPPSLGYAAGPAQEGEGEALGEGTVFVVANNVSPGEDRAFDRWYDEIHIPHTFEHFGFTAARRYIATDPAAPFQRLIAYASPADVDAVSSAMDWAARDRAEAVQQGREAALPVSESLVGPRHAGFYVPASPSS